MGKEFVVPVGPAAGSVGLGRGRREDSGDTDEEVGPRAKEVQRPPLVALPAAQPCWASGQPSLVFFPAPQILQIFSGP